jgi:osmoprotectant transport system substrate-binding protein
MKKVAILALILLTTCRVFRKEAVVVGSKNFTESVILGELIAQKLEAEDCPVQRRPNLGGTLVADKALKSGDIDTYVEYSGTALTAILKHQSLNSRSAVDQYVKSEYQKRDLTWGPNLGFNNTFAIIVRKPDAARFELVKISDLTRATISFQPGFGYEFVSRPDGWNGLLETYRLRFRKPPRTMDLGLTYKALAAGDVDLIAGNSTDGLIDSLNLTPLNDDKNYFPPYDAAIVARRDIDKKCRGARAALDSLGGILSDSTMRELNYEVDGKRRDPAVVVKEFFELQKKLAEQKN